MPFSPLLSGIGIVMYRENIRNPCSQSRKRIAVRIQPRPVPITVLRASREMFGNLPTKSRVLLGAPPERVERSPKYFIFQRYSRRCRLLCSNKMCRWRLRVPKANGLQPGSQSRVQLCLHRFAPRRLQTTALQSFRQESGPSRFRQTQRMSKRA